MSRPQATTAPPSLKTSPQTLLSPQASLSGTHPITLGASAVIQVRARVVAIHGPVTIGEGCIISERASIGILTGADGDDGGVPKSANIIHDEQRRPLNGEKKREGGEGEGVGVCLDRGVVVETGAVVEACFVGEGSVVEVGATIGRGSVIGKVSFFLLGWVIASLADYFGKFDFLSVSNSVCWWSFQGHAFIFVLLIFTNYAA